ncbi:MAG TPA: adenylate/guanylate cyclase domain-containing protein [Rectinemataceae bacterium]|nr:adenylate/guanylate cyclase domain-containing protein [Rectinemataceae bacterium]
MHELLLADRLKGEREIAVFRIILIASTALMVLLMVAMGGEGFTVSDTSNLIAVGAAGIYTIVLLLLIVRRGYRRWYGFASATVDVLLISASTYLSRYAAESSIASLVSTSSFVIYFPIILFSVRRHDPVNTLYTGILSAVLYGAMIVDMAVEHSFWVTLSASNGLIMRNDMFNEILKAIVLAATGFIGWAAARRFDRLFEDALRAAREKEQIKDMFGRYVSDTLVDKIMAKEIALEGEKRNVTVMFIDIRNFTPLAESVEPQTLIVILNNFFDVCIDTIIKHGGFIDKFIGDAIMVVFGAPESDSRHCDAAVACALELQSALKTMNAWVHSLGVEWEFGYGIGINSGDAIVGNVGTERRMEYTALGDAVNVASRLERLTRHVSRPILVGEACAAGCSDHLFEGPFTARIKGKSEPVKVYAVAGRRE